MARTPKSLTGLASAAALLATAGAVIAFLAGEVAAGRAPAPGAPRAKVPGVARSALQPPGLTSPTPAGPWLTSAAPLAAPASPSPLLEPVDPEADPDATRALMESMKRLVSDLEWNSNRGLPEPPQQTVAPQPDPWRPPVGSEAAAAPIIDQVAPARSPTRGGTRVTIRGKNLRAAEVMFGLSPASIVASSEREVTVLAPAAPSGPVTIVLTNSDGSYAMAGASFTYAD